MAHSLASYKFHRSAPRQAYVQCGSLALFLRYGFRKLIENRAIDIIQPDVMWLGGLTELIKVARCVGSPHRPLTLKSQLTHISMAAAYDIPVVPHGSGPYSFQAIMSFPNSDFCEYIVSLSSAFLRLSLYLLTPSPSPSAHPLTPLPSTRLHLLPLLFPHPSLNITTPGTSNNTPSGQLPRRQIHLPFLRQPFPQRGPPAQRPSRPRRRTGLRARAQPCRRACALQRVLHAVQGHRVGGRSGGEDKCCLAAGSDALNVECETGDEVRSMGLELGGKGENKGAGQAGIGNRKSAQREMSSGIHRGRSWLSDNACSFQTWRKTDE